MHQICTVLSCTISSFMMMGHLFYYNEPNLQKHIIRILFMIPVYSVSSMASIMYPEHILVFAAVRDFYEAYVLYTFIQLLIEYLGGLKSLQIHLEFKVSQPYLSSSAPHPPTLAPRQGEAPPDGQALPDEH